MVLSSAQQMEIDLKSLTLKEKIAQMIMVRGDSYNQRFLELGVGGIFIDRQKTKEDYKQLINRYQSNSKIKLLVSTDLEGFWNPFPFFQSRHFGDIKTGEEAYALGKSHGEILKELGFNMDFSPIVESKNTVWPGRNFMGLDEEINLKAISYIKGLEDKGIMATVKHYPGGSMVKNPHWFRYTTQISEEDLGLFNEAIKNEVSAVMIGHPIVTGAIDSNGKQSTVSKEVISHLRKDFDGLIITDAIWMFGLRWSYLFNSNGLYIDLVNAGNDIILDISASDYIFFANHGRVKRGISAIEKAVEEGKISEARIDESVVRILEAKGYKVNV